MMGEVDFEEGRGRGGESLLVGGGGVEVEEKRGRMKKGKEGMEKGEFELVGAGWDDLVLG